MMNKLITRTASSGLTLTGLHSSNGKVKAKPHSNVEFLYGVLLGLIVATSISGLIAAWLATSSLQ